jgi:G3E family GTPase
MDSSDDDDEPPILVDLAAAAQAQTAATAATTAATATAPEQNTKASLQTNNSENDANDANDEDVEPLPPCPVTILSGFLGSGKTTLIQYILKNPNHGKRIAVIENEFGEGLAVESLIARDGVDPNSDSLQEFIELPNGCICCTVKDSLVETLETLVDRKKDLDYILIEASGMANPGPIASVFWLDEALESRLQLDGIVTLVDANNILEQLATTEEAAQQIAYSDRLLINKIDTLPQNTTGIDTTTATTENSGGGDTDTTDKSSSIALDKVKEALRKLHPTAPMMTTTYSKVPDLDWILNANCFGGASRLEELDTLWNQATTDEETTSGGTDGHGRGHDDDDELGHGHDHSHDHSHDHGDDCQVCQSQQQKAAGHRHTDAVTTLALHKSGSVSLTKLNAWLADILWPHQDESNQVLTALLHDPSKKDEFMSKQNKTQAQKIFRIKGIVSVVHDVEHLLDATEVDKYTTPVAAVAGTGTATKNNPLLLDRRRYIIQAVHDLWEVHPASDNLQFEEDDDRDGKMVVIGKHLPKHRLEHGFQACFVDSTTNS